MMPDSSFRETITSAVVLALVGWGGLAVLVALTLPTVWPRWLFFLLWVVANKGGSREPHVILRQALWVGVFGATMAWLQLGRHATAWVALGLAAGLGAMEYLIRMRELASRRSAWPEPASKPPDHGPTP
jgi:hypothetical protein